MSFYMLRPLILSLCRQYFSWVHDSLGVDGILDAPHGVNSGWAELCVEQGDLACADAVLSCARAAKVDGPGGHAVGHFLATLVVVGVRGVKQQDHMEIAVADVAKHGT